MAQVGQDFRSKEGAMVVLIEPSALFDTFSTIKALICLSFVLDSFCMISTFEGSLHHTYADGAFKRRQQCEISLGPLW